ncbi:DUF1109 domain-containing protein [Sphingomonas sp. NIBR02145]|uniref:DUF1109 domain-containing protein n=1 Tax=Sphingomonas sp. NIBR02145 TaxID=3014784 RepID=UPI0022B4327B|nr:DUF1109 domain-containing protein [Sphingomonas sp. NIBR02145]WHU02486.1 DUF1109 domain-containing protein [Sphingomonas sp. NIBR02145]
MNTEDLISRLSQNVPPVPRRTVGWRLGIGLALGGLVSAALVALVLGIRPDLGLAMRGTAFWVKWSYTFSLAIAAVVMVVQLARPDSARLRWAWLLVVPVSLLAILGVAELARTPPGEWLAMWLGHSWMICPWLVLALAMPIFIGLLWSFRRLAPTRLRAAGAAAGLAAGAFAATVYCMHCPEVSAIFVLTWYSLGILLAASLGALLGPRLLRW